MTCNEPNATTPPTLAATKYEKWWTFVKGSYIASQYNTYKQCPSGWGLMNTSRMTYLFSGHWYDANRDGSDNIHMFDNTQDLNTAISIIRDEWAATANSAGEFFHLQPEYNNYVLGFASGSNGFTVRCWRQYNDNTDR